MPTLLACILFGKIIAPVKPAIAVLSRRIPTRI